ncbi:DNA polymerase III subunit epsilon [Jannaschia sp. CCS1]|uniref:DNA polymerase III subunit epsilon n=1 Tax=Jannaschia sp. (strain CCS1) TaxID=290400 RepID=UPI000053CBD7|nr:DNA polymerase III subunit epsilon [Jannaschia sp. CCS1]ABD53111.1 DNA polymerase III epsilon subunit [Jannaschia sp. CCS1]
MREIVLDTETTGLNPYDMPRHRIVEIGAVEIFNQVPTGKTYHQYIQPERDMPKEAFDVHGIGEDFLADKPIFADIAQDFLDFVGGDQMVIHNAEFDMRFLNAELEWAGKHALPNDQALDTLKIARQKFPGSPASLDALCRRFGIDNSAREKHGALLDSEILAEVYLELTGGKQPDFGLSQSKSTPTQQQDENWRPRPRPSALPTRLSDVEKAAHAAFVDALGDQTVWSKFR